MEDRNNNSYAYSYLSFPNTSPLNMRQGLSNSSVIPFMIIKDSSNNITCDTYGKFIIPNKGVYMIIYNIITSNNATDSGNDYVALQINNKQVEKTISGTNSIGGTLSGSALIIVDTPNSILSLICLSNFEIKNDQINTENPDNIGSLSIVQIA